MYFLCYAEVMSPRMLLSLAPHCTPLRHSFLPSTHLGLRLTWGHTHKDKPFVCQRFTTGRCDVCVWVWGGISIHFPQWCTGCGCYKNWYWSKHVSVHLCKQANFWHAFWATRNTASVLLKRDMYDSSIFKQIRALCLDKLLWTIKQMVLYVICLQQYLSCISIYCITLSLPY